MILKVMILLYSCALRSLIDAALPVVEWYRTGHRTAHIPAQKHSTPPFQTQCQTCWWWRDMETDRERCCTLSRNSSAWLFSSLETSEPSWYLWVKGNKTWRVISFVESFNESIIGSQKLGSLSFCFLKTINLLTALVLNRNRSI